MRMGGGKEGLSCVGARQSVWLSGSPSVSLAVLWQRVSMCCEGHSGSAGCARGSKELAAPAEGRGKKRRRQCCMELPRRFTEKVGEFFPL